MKLNPHPRLYLKQAEFDNCKDEKQSPFLQTVQEELVKAADALLEIKEPDYPRNTHNEHLIRARTMQKNVVSLLCRFVQTSDNKYKDAILAYVKMMRDWEVWSWIAWRDGNNQPDAIFDLSYGENTTTLAIAYDGLFNCLSDDEKGLFLETAEKWSFPSWRKNAAASWWLGKSDSNWNSVCAGGMGMLALAMLDDIGDADEVLELAKRSLIPFFNSLDHYNGGWPEGVGYWNYGMRYAFMFLFSLENAFCRQDHETNSFLHLEGVRKTLFFPLDFCPFGVSGGFGDANNWRPLPFHYLASLQLGCPELADKLLDLVAELDIKETCWPDFAEWLFVTSQNVPETTGSGQEFEPAKLYRGLDWGRITDSPVAPAVYLTFRGGTTQVPHSHADLMSFNYFQKRERMIVNTSCGAYIDTTFSERRWELSGMNALSKNTIIINGVGIKPGSELVATGKIAFGNIVGIRMDATNCFGEMRSSDPLKFTGRLLLLLPNATMLIIDHVQLKHVGLVESRMHTDAECEKGESGFLLKGRKEMTSVSYASNVDCVHATATTTPTHISSPCQTVLRYGSLKQHHSVVLATVLSPGERAATATVSADNDAIKVCVNSGGSQTPLCLDHSLREFPPSNRP